MYAPKEHLAVSTFLPPPVKYLEPPKTTTERRCGTKQAALWLRRKISATCCSSPGTAAWHGDQRCVPRSKISAKGQDM